MFEIKTHKLGIQKAKTFINDYRTQEKPKDMLCEEWEEYRIKRNDVLIYLKRLIGCNVDNNRFKERNEPDPIETTKFKNLNPDLKALHFAKSHIINNGTVSFNLNEVQRIDTAKLIMKRYALLNGEMGTGKTGQIFTVAESRKVKQKIILSSAVSIKQTWRPFLTANKKTFKIIKTSLDLDYSFEYWIITTNQLYQNKHLTERINKALSKISYNVQFLFDESHRMGPIGSSTQRAVYKAFINALCQVFILI